MKEKSVTGLEMSDDLAMMHAAMHAAALGLRLSTSSSPDAAANSANS